MVNQSGFSYKELLRICRNPSVMESARIDAGMLAIELLGAIGSGIKLLNMARDGRIPDEVQTEAGKEGIAILINKGDYRTLWSVRAAGEGYGLPKKIHEMLEIAVIMAGYNAVLDAIDKGNEPELESMRRNHRLPEVVREYAKNGKETAALLSIRRTGRDAITDSELRRDVRTLEDRLQDSNPRIRAAATIRLEIVRKMKAGC